uniref:Uncharacterized protein n=1 Tax=Eptatretus burgeri TaxID=7764 RepID=A0A8C4RBQ5_EPTBU
MYCPDTNLSEKIKMIRGKNCFFPITRYNKWGWSFYFSRDPFLLMRYIAIKQPLSCSDVTGYVSGSISISSCNTGLFVESHSETGIALIQFCYFIIERIFALQGSSGYMRTQQRSILTERQVTLEQTINEVKKRVQIIQQNMRILEDFQDDFDFRYKNSQSRGKTSC